MNIENVIIVCTIIISAFLIVGSIVDMGILDAVRAEDARQQCFALGSTTYLDYKAQIFGTKAMGVKCEYPATTQNVNFNNANPLVEINSDN